MRGRCGALALASFICLAAAVSAAPQPGQKMIRVFVPPECKGMFYSLFLSEAELRRKPNYVLWDSTHAKSIAFRDPKTATSFYVESDGRHLAAIGPDGKLLWVRNLFEDAKLCPYRSPRPVIYSLKVFDVPPGYATYMKRRGANPRHHFIRIEFDSSQFGEVDETTGDFLNEGQN